MNTDMTMRCEDVAPYLSAFADGELPEPLRSEVAEHVATCESCSATLARYAEIDALVAGLPRSAPSPEALDLILAAVAAEDEREEQRRATREMWGLTSVKRRLTRLDMPVGDDALPLRPRQSQRARWVSVALPAIAALLLISVTLVTFRWLPTKGQIFQGDVPTPTPAPGSVTLADTRAAVSAIQAQLAFKPLLPSYLPDGATINSVEIGPRDRDTDIAEHTLDISWSITGSVQMIHLHEAPGKIGVSGYSAYSGRPQLQWQIGDAPWRQVRADAHPDHMVIEQRRAGVTIALEAPVKTNSPQAAAGQTLLRLISLSMDAPYAVMPAAPDENSARILPLKIQDMVAHYTAVALTSDGATAWRQDVYVAPCTSPAQPCQVRAAYSLGATGPLLYTEIASGQRMLHLDQAQKTFTWQPLIPAEQGANLTTTAMPKLFFVGNTYLSTGILWYMGETSYKGQRVYDLLWTNAPSRTHVYVSTASHQVVAMQVDPHAKIQAGGPIAGAGARSCLRYTMLEYLPPSDATDTLLAQTIPDRYTESQDTQISLTC